MAQHQYHQQYPQYATQLDEYGNPILQHASAASPGAIGGGGTTSSSSRQNDELFFNHPQSQAQPYSQPPAPPPRLNATQGYASHVQQRYQYQPQPPTPSQPSYSPQAFPRPQSLMTGQPYNSTQSPQVASPHAPYNPADYHSDSLNRLGTAPGQANYGLASPTIPSYSPGLQQTPTFASPPMPQQSYGRSSLYGPPRPVIHTNSFTSEQGAPPPPPRPAQYGLTVPPLSTIPGSATDTQEGWNDLPSNSTSPRQQAGVSPPIQQPYAPPGSDPYSTSQQSYPSPHLYQQHRHSLSQHSPHGSHGSAEPRASHYATPHHPLPPTPTPPAPPPHDPHRPQVAHMPQPQHYTGPGQSPQSYEELQEQERLTAEQLMNQVEQEVMGLSVAQANSPSIQVDTSHAQRHQGTFLFERSPQTPHDNRNGSLTNGHLTPDANYTDFLGSESDLEADAGVEAMRIAEQEEAAEEARRQSGSGGSHSRYGSYSSQSHTLRESYHDEDEDESDGQPVDLSLIGGGFDAPHMSYGGAPKNLTVERHSSQSHAGSQSHPPSSHSSMRRSEKSDMDSATLYDYDENIHPFPPFVSNARVDTGGTGGLEEPTMHMRRRSYDEGDEFSLADNAPNYMPDLYFHPGMPDRRPLPPPPAGESPSLGQGMTPYPQDDYDNQIPYHESQQPHTPQWPQAPENYIPASASSPNVPRSTSLLAHNTQPQAVAPLRSRTDAEERERKWRQSQQQRRSAYLNDSASDTPASASAVTLDLPTLPTAGRYNPTKLGSKDYARCTEPWALSGIVAWLKAMTEGEQDLREVHLLQGLVKLFTAKVPTMNIADAETLAARLTAQMREDGVLVQEEEWLKFTQQTMTGVIYQLTGAGCYSSKLHAHNISGRCYSHHCQRTLKKVDLSAQPALKATEDWAVYYKLKKEDIESVGPKEVERQNILFEIVQKEDKYMDDLNVLRVLYRDALHNANPAIITPQRLPGFIRDVFGKADAVKKANEDHLLPQLKYRQREQGPWVVGFSDIFRQWIRKAKSAYIDYASAFPNANFRIRKEEEKNVLFRSFLNNVRSNRLSGKLGWDTYLKVPITKLQQYGLLLETVLRRSVVDSEEKRNLQVAIDEIREVTRECDEKVALMTRKVNLQDLQNKLKQRPDKERVDLNLDHLGRELIFKGDLQRVGANRFTWLETHAILFDHYLVLAKTSQDREANGDRTETYDVSRPPIPMDLLILESRDDNPVVKAKTGIASVTTVVPTANDPTTRLGRISSSQSVPPAPGQLHHSNTSTSLTSLNTVNTNRTTVTTTVLDQPGGNKDDKTMFPFRIKHLGKDVYTLYAPSAQNREDWCDKILEAKTRHATSLFEQNAEPFRLRVMADCAFGYESSNQSLGRSIVIRGTPLDRAVREVEEKYRDVGRPTPICRARVNCATSFTQSDGKEMCALGTDFGVYISSLNDPRGWNRVIPTNRVTQVAVLEEFNMFLLIADKSLIAYHLDVVCPVGGGPSNVSTGGTRGAPQKLSSSSVGFFCTGRMKDRQLVFFKKRENLNSVFKVCRILSYV